MKFECRTVSTAVPSLTELFYQAFHSFTIILNIDHTHSEFVLVQRGVDWNELSGALGEVCQANESQNPCLEAVLEVPKEKTACTVTHVKCTIHINTGYANYVLYWYEFFFIGSHYFIKKSALLSYNLHTINCTHLTEQFSDECERIMPRKPPA